MRFSTFLAVLLVGVTDVPAGAQTDPSRPPRASQTAPALRIVVLEGEAAVNIVRQKTAVVPLVEVRDRNDQPVAGAVVTFAVRSGRAAFGGSRTLTVTTNAAGRAAATGLTPTGSGAVQIGASAVFQGQTASVTIAQTNVLTAAEAAAASGAGAPGGGAGGGGGASAAGAGGGAGGGGFSGVAIAGIAGGAAAGVGVAVAKGRSDSPTTVVPNLSVVFSPAPAPFFGNLCPGFPNLGTNSWRARVIVTETNGAGYTVAKFSNRYFGANGRDLGVVDYDTFTITFSGCGPTGLRIPPGGTVCSDLCWVLPSTERSGGVQFIFTGTDDTGRSQTFTSTILGFLSP